MKKRDKWVTTNEPNPVESKGDMWKEVMKDMEARRQMGLKKYGTFLQPFNGRDALVDAYQEALDLVVYLRQKIEEDKIKEENVK